MFYRVWHNYRLDGKNKSNLSLSHTHTYTQTHKRHTLQKASNVKLCDILIADILPHNQVN